jgi:transcriptional regulator with XRE-family HTH domain
MRSQDDIDMEIRALKLGSKIRKLRQNKHYTLQDVATKTGLSKPFLSQIENDHVVPPVATLLKLARAFNVALAHFFQDDARSDKIAITRRHERVRIEKRPHHRKGEVNYVYESLETKKSDKHMEPFLVEFPVQETSEMVFMNHQGEEFLHVLSGSLEFRSTDRVEVLQTGDSIYFEAEVSHSFRCLGEQPARALVVVWSCT